MTKTFKHDQAARVRMKFKDAVWGLKVAETRREVQAAREDVAFYRAKAEFSARYVEAVFPEQN